MYAIQIPDTLFPYLPLLVLVHTLQGTPCRKLLVLVHILQGAQFLLRVVNLRNLGTVHLVPLPSITSPC